MRSGRFKRFEDTKAASEKFGNRHLGRILAEGVTEEERATFYSCFLRASLSE
jgi:putative alpha-1,2-mannosidase